MSKSVTYFGFALAPIPLVIVGEDETGVSLARPGTEEVIVSGVQLVGAPTEGAAVLDAAPEPAKAPAKATKEPAKA